MDFRSRRQTSAVSSRLLFAVALVSAALLGESGVRAAEVKIDATPLGSMTIDGTGRPAIDPFFSADAKHVVVVVAKGSRKQVLIDGTPGPLIQSIDSPAIFSADGTRVAYVAKLDSGKSVLVLNGKPGPECDAISELAFAPAGNHFAYRAKQGKKFFVVDNGKAGLLYDSINNDHDSPTMVFSPDGEHFVYVALAQPTASGPGEAQRLRVVLDGVEQKHFDTISSLTFSKNGKHFGYLAGPGISADRAVVDGKDGPTFPVVRGLTLSDDGSRALCVGTLDQQKFVLVDNGQAGAPTDGIENIAVSADGKRLAYSTYTKDTPRPRKVIDNGKEGLAYGEVRDLQIAPDGSTLTYVAAADGGQYIVVNGEEFGPLSLEGKVTFSPDFKHWACIARQAGDVGASYLLLDGKNVALPAGIRTDSITFSGTGTDLTLAGGSPYDGSATTVQIIGGKAGPIIPGSILTSANGKHQLKVTTTKAGTSEVQQQIAVDDQPAAASVYQSIEDAAISDDGKHVAYRGTYYGSSGDALSHVVYDGVEGPKYRSIRDVALSPDGKHVAYVAALPDRTEAVIIDGTSGPAMQLMSPKPESPRPELLRFSPDGTLHFFAVIDGQLNRCEVQPTSLDAALPLAQADAQAAGLRTIHKFDGDEGTDVVALAAAPDGSVFGITRTGGKYNKGTLFGCKADGTDFAILHPFYGGAKDGETPNSLVVAPDGTLYGYANASNQGTKAAVFHYEPASKTYTIVKATNDLGAVIGFTPQGELIGAVESQRSNTPTLWTMKTDGSDVKTHKLPEHVTARDAKAGPDGAVYVETGDTLFKLASVDAQPTLLHKFVDAPDDGIFPVPSFGFDAAGNVYGLTKQGALAYRVDGEGKEYKLISNPDKPLNARLITLGSDGQPYAIATADGFGRGSGLLKLSSDGGDATPVANDDVVITGQLARGGDNLYCVSRVGLCRATIASKSAAPAGAPPTVAINVVPAVPLALETIETTAPTGNAATDAPTAANAAKPGQAPTQPPSHQSPPTPQNPPHDAAADARRKADEAKRKADEAAHKAADKLRGIFH